MLVRERFEGIAEHQVLEATVAVEKGEPHESLLLEHARRDREERSDAASSCDEHERTAAVDSIRDAEAPRRAENADAIARAQVFDEISGDGPARNTLARDADACAAAARRAGRIRAAMLDSVDAHDEREELTGLERWRRGHVVDEPYAYCIIGFVIDSSDTHPRLEPAWMRRA